MVPKEMRDKGKEFRSDWQNVIGWALQFSGATPVLNPRAQRRLQSHHDKKRNGGRRNGYVYSKKAVRILKRQADRSRNAGS